MTLIWTAIYSNNEARAWTAKYTPSEFKEVFTEDQRKSLRRGQSVEIKTMHVNYFVKK